MAKLTTAQRNKLHTSKFADPENRKYPVNDREHAGNAKSRVSAQFNKGKVSRSYKNMIDRAANKVLGKGGSTVKGQNRKDKSDESKGMDQRKRRARKDSRDERAGMKKSDSNVSRYINSL